MKRLLTKTHNAAFWNTISGLINAGQSAVILIFISRYLGQSAAGIFSIAYALGNLFSTMGKYGVRNFQVTDVKEVFLFHEYLVFRIISTGFSTLLLMGYLFMQRMTGAYTAEKLMAVLIICLWKMIDPVEDVYYGMYQQQDRLDIGALCYSLRLGISTLLFCVLVLLGVPILLTSLAVFAVSALCAVLFINSTKNVFTLRREGSSAAHVAEIAKQCFPLFIGTSLAIYVGNAPRYMIDSYLRDETIQAAFSYIMMPAFVIMMINQFIYQPFIRGLGELWNEGRRKQFTGSVARQYLICILITVAVVIPGVLFGTQALSALYHVELSSFRKEFAVILCGGGAYALATYLSVPITAIRSQKVIAAGYIFTSVLSLLAGKYFVAGKGIMGAAELYLVLNLSLAVFFTVFLIYKVYLKHEKN